MKQIRLLASGLVACVVVLTATALSAQTVQDGIAKVVNIKGNARYMTAAGNPWQPLKVGAVLKPGAIIQTAAKSSVDIILNNPDATTISGTPRPTPLGTVMGSTPAAQQDAVRIYENTVLGVDKLTVMQTGADTVTETQLDLKAGRIFGTVKKLSGASTYEVKIPNGVAGIRGTIYMLSADGMLSVLSGSVVLAYVMPDGSVKTQVVGARQQFDLNTGLLTDLLDGLLDDLIQTSMVFDLGEEGPPPGGPGPGDHRIIFISPVHGGPPFQPPGPPP